MFKKNNSGVEDAEESFELMSSSDRRSKKRSIRKNSMKGAEENLTLQELRREWDPIFMRVALTPDDLPDVSVQRGHDVPDASGKFKAKDLESHLREMKWRELENQLGLSWYKIRDIIRRSDPDGDGIIEYEDFLKALQRYRLSTEQSSGLKSVVKAFAYAEEFTCNPPPLFMLIITAIEAAIFIFHAIHLPAKHGLPMGLNGPVPYCSVLIYNPYRRQEAWRFLTYMFVHIGIFHFVFNMIMQLFVGVFLEMSQEGWKGSLKVAVIYLSGVIAGSLGTSLADPYTYIAGASAGVYALISAHLATLALNWQEDSAIKIKKVIHQPLTRIVRLVFIISLTIHDIGFAIYVRFFSEEENRTGFVGHLCGAIAGLLVGVFVLDNRRVQSWESWIQWISLVIFALMIGFAIFWNILGDQIVGGRGFYPRPDYKPLGDENCDHYDYI